jgi:hypothetical protein
MKPRQYSICPDIFRNYKANAAQKLLRNNLTSCYSFLGGASNGNDVESFQFFEGGNKINIPLTIFYAGK